MPLGSGGTGLTPGRTPLSETTIPARVAARRCSLKGHVQRPVRRLGRVRSVRYRRRSRSSPARPATGRRRPRRNQGRGPCRDAGPPPRPPEPGSPCRSTPVGGRGSGPPSIGSGSGRGYPATTACAAATSAACLRPSGEARRAPRSCGGTYSRPFVLDTRPPRRPPTPRPKRGLRPAKRRRVPTRPSRHGARRTRRRLRSPGGRPTPPRSRPGRC